jgi:hypothetical protein
MNFEKIRFQFTHQERVARITLASPKAIIYLRNHSPKHRMGGER